MTISVRGSNVAYVNSTSSGSIALPAGTVAGDLCILFVEHGNAPIQPELDWFPIDDSSGSNVSGAVYMRVLNATEIAFGSVVVNFSASSSGTLAIVTFVGPLAGYRTVIAARSSTGATSRTLTTDSTPQSGDYALYFGSGRSNVTVTSSSGSTLQSASNAGSSAILAGGLLGSAGAVSSTFGFSAAPNGDYEVILIIAETPLSTLNLRQPLIVSEILSEGYSNLLQPFLVSEALSEGQPNLLQSLLTGEALSEGYPNVRMALLVVEVLHPVPPEGTVSTELFPGSLGSSVSLPGLAFAFHKKPSFATITQTAASGVSARTALMQYPIWHFEATFEFLRDDVNNEYQTLLGFFLKRLGAWDTFLFKDANDYNVTGGAIATADGVTTQFPFVRVMGGFSEKVGQVDNGLTINVYDNGVLQTPGTDYNVVLPNLMVFTVAPTAGHAITADFQFFFNCKFSDDMADFDEFADHFWELQSLPFETVPQ